MGWERVSYEIEESHSHSKMKALESAQVEIKGVSAYQKMLSEAGVHRVRVEILCF